MRLTTYPNVIYIYDMEIQTLFQNEIFTKHDGFDSFVITFVIF